MPPMPCEDCAAVHFRSQKDANKALGSCPAVLGYAVCTV